MLIKSYTIYGVDARTGAPYRVVQPFNQTQANQIGALVEDGGLPPALATRLVLLWNTIAAQQENNLRYEVTVTHDQSTQHA